MLCIDDALRAISETYQEKKMFLDVGCGGGNRTLIFKDYGRRVFGVDRLVWLSDAAKREITFTQADFMQGRLSFEDSFFDIIFSFDVIEHLPEPKMMLREIRRLLNKNGVFVISTPNRERLCAFFLYKLGLRRLPFCPDESTKSFDPYAAHVIEYTDSELRALLDAEGFSVIRSHRLFYGLPGRTGIPVFFSLPLYHNMIIECKKK